MKKRSIIELNRITVEEFKKADKLPLVIVLDNVRSLHNVGSVFRTSDAYTIECIHLCGITATPPNPEIHKTALGAEFSVEWKYYKTVFESIEELKKQGYKVFAIEQVEDSQMLNSFVPDKNTKYAVILGNEVKGVQQEAVDMCEGSIEIPQYGTKHSLNVSVTAGIVVWDFFNKLTGSVNNLGE